MISSWSTCHKILHILMFITSFEEQNITYRSCSNLRIHLFQTLINFQRHIVLPQNAAFLRLILEQAQRNPALADYIIEQGPKHIQCSISNALTQAHDAGLINCPRPDFSAQFYFGIIRELEWRILMNMKVDEDEQETINYIHYCVDRFLDGHQ
nr:TetR/AcrR family transcriptional regulator C-terminal domain-containing protein [Acinetobacter chinensis]